MAAIAGLVASAPLRWLVDRHGIEALLAMLVLATGLIITVSDIGSALSSWRRMLIALTVGATVLPASSWLASRIVRAGSLRDGVMIIGLAPCEIASVATTMIADGDPAVAGGMLVGSTILTVVIAGPILGLEARQASLDIRHVISNLLIIVVAPLALGIVVRAIGNLGAAAERTATRSATVAVVSLVALIASQIHPSMSYVAVLAAVGMFVAGSGMIGVVLGIGAEPHVSVPILLTTSMRDFAIAAGIAASAFGPAAAAPLGLYGIVVLLWGTVVAGRQRANSRPALASEPA